MKKLQQMLNQVFAPPPRRREPDPTYRTFRAQLKKLGVTYRIAGDSYIEFSDGIAFGHYGDWEENLVRYLDERETRAKKNGAARPYANRSSDE